MTITTNAARNEYTATASQTVFNYTFKIYDSGDLNVYVTPVGQDPDDAADITTDYVVDAGTIGDEAGGFITFNTGITVDYAVTIVSDIPENRTTDYQVNGDFDPPVVNDDFDRVVSIVKQLSEQVDRSIVARESEQGASGKTLPVPDDGKGLIWDGTDLVNSDDNINGITTAAAASAAAALVSENAASVSAAAALSSENNASTSESNASTSETNSAASAAAALVSENAADASATAAEVAKIEWQGTYNAGTAYALNDAVAFEGSSFINIQAGTGNEPAVGGTAFWDDLANKGADGAGDLTAANNLSDVADADTSAVNLGLEAGATKTSRRNALYNPNFEINQREVSGTVVLASGEYGHDRFKGGASGCTYTFATSANVTTITISAGSLLQIIEGENLFTDTYALSWTGTAQGKIGAGSFSASGVTGAVTGGADTTIEFNTGTLSLTQLEKGSIVSDFDLRPIGEELSLCKRYYQRIDGATSFFKAISGGLFTTTTNAAFSVFYPQEMRVAPAFSSSGTFQVSQAATTLTVTGLAAVQINKKSVGINATVASGGVVGQSTGMNAGNDDAAFLEFNSEL